MGGVRVSGRCEGEVRGSGRVKGSGRMSGSLASNLYFSVS